MTDSQAGERVEDPEFQAYVDRCFSAWEELFAAARGREELQFAMALNPEFRGMQDAGWSTAEDTHKALEQYLELLNNLPSSPVKVRIALSLYSHLSEASGFYEVPKAIAFFQTLEHQMMDTVRTYATPKQVVGRVNNHAPALPAIISYDETTGSFSIRSGMSL